jgi:3-hydroxyisobutyrate dehydrogenase
LATIAGARERRSRTDPPPGCLVKALRLGFIGFGEAGFHLARGLAGAGLANLSAYDIDRTTPGRGETIGSRARESGVDLVGSSGDLARCDVLLSVVVAGAAVEAAREASAWLSPKHVYADLNSVSPETKREVDSIASGAGAAFVEGAVMAPISRLGHRVPILLGGKAAPLLVERLSPYGMRLEVVSDRVGSAAAVKMCRSIVVKGLEAVLLECVMASGRYGAGKRVFESLGESFPGLDWERLAGYMIGRVVRHGARRAQEMEEVVRTLECVGIDPIMARAAAERLKWCADLHVERSFGENPPEDYREVASAIEDILSGPETARDPGWIRDGGIR